jgi:hypothetical protein
MRKIGSFGFAVFLAVLPSTAISQGPPPAPPTPGAITNPNTTPAPAQAQQSVVMFNVKKLAATTRPAVALVTVLDKSGKPLKLGTGFFVSPDGKLPWPLRLNARVTAPRSVEMPRPHQLLVAVIRTPWGVCRAFLASAMATAKRLIDEFSIRVPVGEALALRPDTRVDNADGDIFAGSGMRSCASRTAQLLPNSARCIQAEKVWCWWRVLTKHFVRGHREDTVLLLECRGLFGCELCGKAVVANPVIIDLLPTANFPESCVVLALEVTDVSHRVWCGRVNLAAMLWRCRIVTSNTAE